MTDRPPDVVIGEDEAAMLYYNNQQRLGQFVVYNKNTREYPGKWITRFWLAVPSPQPTQYVMVADSLEGIRALLPPGPACLARSPGDAPEIYEVWL